MNWVTRLSIILYLFAFSLFYEQTINDLGVYPFQFLIAGIVETLLVLFLGYFGSNAITRDCQKIGLLLVVTHASAFAVYMINDILQTKIGYNWYVNLQIMLIIAQYIRPFWRGRNDENINSDFWLDRLRNTGLDLRRMYHQEQNP